MMAFRTKFEAGNFLVWWQEYSGENQAISLWIEQFHDGELIRGKRFFVRKDIWTNRIFADAIRDPRFIRDRIFILEEGSTISEVKADIKIETEESKLAMNRQIPINHISRGDGKSKLALIKMLRMLGFSDDAITELLKDEGNE